MLIATRLHQTASALGLALCVLTLQACGASADPVPAQKTASGPTDTAMVEEATLFEAEGEEITAAVQAALANQDPALEGFDSEVLHGRAKPVLAALVKLFQAHHPENFTAKLITTDFSSAPLRPANLERIFDDGSTIIDEAPGFSAERHAAAALPGLISTISERLDTDEIHTKAKLFSIDLGAAGTGFFESDALVRVAGPIKKERGKQDGGELQINMEWRVGFQVINDEEIRLRSIELTSYREIQVPAELYADLTKQAFGSIPFFREDFLIGTGDYHFRTDRMNGNAYTGSMGLAIGDVNGDGLDDILVCQPGGTPNRLLVRLPDGTVDDRSSGSGLDLLTKTQSALIIDLDNDGDQDVAMACRSAIVIAENDGTGTFTMARRPLVASADEITSLSAADYDRDGDLDIYACMYAKAGLLGTTPVPYHDAVNGPPNHMWRNDGGWAFKDVTAEVGLDDNNVKFSYAAIWEDFDRDGDLDLYVANDFGRNHFYRNEDGKFRDVAEEVGADDMAAGMGATVADFDLDGQMDLYVTNMFSSAGRRIVPQSKFMDGENQELHDELLRHARGNTLLLNQGDGTFRDATEQGGSMIAGWGWGSKALDLNNDGLPDIYSPNGWLTNEKHDDL